MFNDHQRPSLFLTSGLTSLQTIIAQQIENDTQRNSKEVRADLTVADEKVDSIQLELKKISRLDDDNLQVFEETLLDLFDQATMSNIQ